MLNQNQMQKEDIRRIATPVGNSSHVILPKDWEGYEIILSKIEKNPKKDILQLLEPYLSNIIGVYLYGSYARKEQEKNSDIDIVIITDKKINIEIKKPFDLIQIEEKKLNNFKKINPVLFYSILFNAEPIMNSFFLENLKEKEFGNFKGNFKEYLEDTARAININKKLLNLNKLEKQEYIDNNLIYSLILRLRGIYIIETLIKKEEFSNSSFLKILRNNLAHNPQIYYDTYRSVRDNKKPAEKIKIEEAEKLLGLLNNSLKDIRQKLKNAK
jgi:predicted nucleotidyltransferase